MSERGLSFGNDDSAPDEETSIEHSDTVNVAPADGKLKILFFAANPEETTQLKLAEEFRDIQDRIRESEFRDRIELCIRPALRYRDLSLALMEEKPHIVHFSGHGSDHDELILQDENGNAKPVNGKVVASLFKTLRDDIRLVVFNACYSESQAKGIVQNIAFAIGMNKAIGDTAAIQFAQSFYRAIGFGRTVQEAFDVARIELDLAGIGEESTPQILHHPKADPDQVVLIDKVENTDVTVLNGEESRAATESAGAVAPERGESESPANNWQQPHPDLKVSIAHLPQPGKYFVGREDELAILDKAWLDSQTNIVEFVAFGGVGKSALVAEWLKRMQADEYRGAARVFGHSFYSQGSREDAQASADSFLDQALRFFGESEEQAQKGSPWDKGERLARLVRQQPTLLILDGVEPLQSPPTSGDAEQIRDPGLSALIRELAAGSYRRQTVDGGTDHALASVATGLTVISTRQRVQDIEWLERTPDKSGPNRMGTVTTVSLESLSPESGSALLEKLEVKGSTEQRKEASSEVRGHGLALTLLGNYLREAHAGDVEARHDIGLLDAALDDEQGGHAKRMMQRLELWLSGKFKVRQTKDAGAPFVPAEIKQSGRISLEILRLTGLFDRPITLGEFVALLKDGATDSGPIPGLTEEASEASIPTLNQAIRNLESVNLLVRVSDDPIQFELEPWPSVEGSRPFLDAHPLVREFFAKRLAEGEQGSEGDESMDSPPPALAPSVREAHRRLYEHLKQSAPELPDNLNDMMPLYHAVAHGCKAELHRDAFEDVYDPRIQRGGEFFNIRKLGSTSSEVAALSHFFERQWDEPAKEMSHRKRELLNQIAFDFRSLARLRDAINPMLASLAGLIDLENWSGSAAVASNLSELSLTLGDVSSAVRQGEQSVELADRSGDAFWRMGTRTTLAAALFCAGVTRWPGDRKREPNALASGLSDSPRETPAASAVGSPAHLAFREAEAMQKEMQPQYPLLYSVQGYRYCELLLADVCLRIGNLLAGSSLVVGRSPDRPTGTTEGLPQSSVGRPAVSDVDGSGDPPTTDSGSDNVKEGAPAAQRSVRPTGDGLSELQSEIESLRNRAETALQIAESNNWLLDMGLDHLTLGRTWQLSARLESARSSGLSPSSPVASSDQEPSELRPDREIPVVAESPYSQAEHHLTQSVTLLRQAGDQTYLPRGLLDRAALWREILGAGVVGWAECSEPHHLPSESADAVGLAGSAHPTEFLANAERDLSEAETIAERGSMLIFQIEAALERSRLFLTLAQIEEENRRFTRMDADEARSDLRLSASISGSSSTESTTKFREQAQQKLDEARELVRQTEKPYEPYVPDWDEWDPPEYVGVFKKGDIVGYHCRNDEIERLQTEIDSLAAASEPRS